MSNRGSLDTACTSNASPGLKLKGGLSWPNWIPHLRRIPQKSHCSLPRVADAELGLVYEVIEKVPGFDIWEPRNGGDVHVGSGI